MSRITVEHLGEDRFAVVVRGHVVVVDQPTTDGGQDTGPTPTELFAASLAACVAFYARRYLLRHRLPTAGLAVESDFLMAARPARVDMIRIAVRPPYDLPASRRDGLLAVASHCTVHNSLVHPPDVTVELIEDGANAEADCA